MPLTKESVSVPALIASAVERTVKGSIFPRTHHRIACAGLLAFSLAAAPAFAQTPTPAEDAAQHPVPASVVEKPTGPITLDGLPIVGVEVVGNTRTDSRLILDQIRAQSGQNYSRSLIDVDVRSVAALDRFITVRAEVIPREDEHTHVLKGVVIRFIVEERPIVTAVEIVGNRQFSGATVRDALITRAASSVDPFTLETDRKAILDLYRKKGYTQTTVEVDQKALKEGVVKYIITEGPRSLIRGIYFSGNGNVKASYLKFKISTKTYFWIFRKGILDEDKLEQDMVTIREIYLKKGFIDARVSYSLDYSADKTHINIHFIIIEGPRYRIGKINVTGNKVFPTWELLLGIGKFGKGSYAERDKVDAIQHRIEDKYGHEGYINRIVSISTPYTDTPGVVDLNIDIVEGSAFLVGRVVVRGNPNIQDRVIRRQIRIYPDQTFDLVQVRKSVARLKASRIFSDVRVTPIESPGNPADVRDALVEAAEGQTGKFSVGAGVSTNSGLVGQFSVEQQNFDITNPPQSAGEFLRGQSFKGAGQYFQVLLEPGTQFQRYEVKFEEPYLFDSQYSFGNSLYFFTRGRESWDERRIGDIVTFGRRFGDVWAASLSFRAEQVTISNADDFNGNGISEPVSSAPFNTLLIGYPADSAQQVLDEVGSHFLTSIKPGVSRDTTDSRVFPTTGTRTALSWEQYGAMGGEFTFSKIVLHFDYYKALYEDLFERKTVFHWGNEVDVIAGGTSVFFERFYAGGIGSLRAFKFRGISPREGGRNDPIGGDFSFFSTGEVNFPIYKEVLRGVVFVDIGTVETDIDFDQIRSDAGVGIRLSLPFFGNLPLAVDFGVPITKQPDDETQFIAFSLGGSF